MEQEVIKIKPGDEFKFEYWGENTLWGTLTVHGKVYTGFFTREDLDFFKEQIRLSKL